MSDAFDNLHSALLRLWDAIVDAFTVRVWFEWLALWHVLIAVQVLVWIVMGVVAILEIINR